MINLIIFLIKIIATFLTSLIFWINMLIVLIMWDGKYMKAIDILDLIWNVDKKK